MRLPTVDLREEMARLPWFHTMDLGDGVVTPGWDPTPERVERMHIPAKLKGKTVLDVGAWDGFWSFEAERRGAKRVLATDWYCWGEWGKDGDGATRKAFHFARQALQSRVEDKKIDVMDLSPDTVGVFDLVLFLGVLYHLRHPLLALERIASVTREMLILETHVDMLDCPTPAMTFYPGKECCNDASNWCGPNPPMVEAMLKEVGFRKVVLRDGPFYPSPHSPRCVFHAWR